MRVDKDLLKKHIGITNLGLQIEKNFENFINKVAESGQESNVIQILKDYKEKSTSGAPGARSAVKEYIKNMLLTSFNIYKADEEGKLTDMVLFEGIKLMPEAGDIDLNWVIPFNDPEQLTAEEKFAVLLHVRGFKRPNGRDGAFKYLAEKYDSVKKRDEGDYESRGFVFNELDIDFIYSMEDIDLSFADKLEVITQFIYERIFGLMCLDALAYSDVNEVGFSDSGQYVYCWCGRKYHLSFLKLTEEEARVVQDRAISFDKSVGQLDKNNPERLCHRADGARITVTQPPYFSARNLCIRIFNQSHASYSELEDSEKMRILTAAFVKSGESICMQGGLGTGKTTKMETLFDILDDSLHIGTIEDYFEQHIMKKYPNKRIVEAQAVHNKTLLDAVKTLLRMSVDVADIGEVRDGEALYAFLQLAQSVSIAAWFTTHIINPETTVTRLKNMLMGTGRYMTEQAAVMDIIHYINVIFQHEIIDGKRMISKVVEIVPLVSTSFRHDMELNLNTDSEALQKLYYLQMIQNNPANMYRLNTIMDASDGIVKFVNYPTKRMIEKAQRNPDARPYMEKLLAAVEQDLSYKVEGIA